MAKSNTAEALIDPRTAAADAAADAKAEARSAKARDESRSTGEADPYVRFVVDIWITNFNSAEFGVYKHSRNRAKSRQFSTDMDIYAEVLENGERTGLLGYREELWVKQSGMDRRLVMKLFSETLNWRATMDMMLGRSLQQTIGARGIPVTCFSINANDKETVVYLERSANKWSWMPENFAFFLLEGGVPQFYRIKRDFFDFGGDYTLYDQTGQAIGRIDGKVLTIGGKWKVRVLKERADKQLMTVLKMFTGMIVFNDDCRRHVKQLARGLAGGRIEPRLEKQETDLYMNPRRVR